MPSRMYSKTHPTLHHFTEQCNQHWGHSPRVSGRLSLVALPCTMEYTKNVIRYFEPGIFGPNSNTIAYLPTGWDTAALEASSYAKFRGKLYTGNAQLGVTLASWKQSRDMVVQRSRPIAQQASELFNEIAKSPRAQRALARLRGDKLGDIAQLRALAGLHLEVIFGWQPLVQDLHAACTTVIQDAIPVNWVRASSAGGLRKKHSGSYPGFGGWDITHTNQVRITRSAAVRVTNPNLWLAERAGLLNPAAVAWDLVPWSFVVNMFVNVNALINSISDFAGLTFDNSSTTTTYRITASETYTDPLGRASSQMYSSGRFKYRTLRADAPPPLTFKIPDLNWGTAAMASSLMLGKVRHLSKFL